MSQTINSSDFQAADVDLESLAKTYSFTKKIYHDIYPRVDPGRPENSASGKNVLITGGSRGTGKGIALAWAEAGASSITITGRNLERLKDAESEIKKACSKPETKVLALQCEATDLQAVQETFSKVKAEVGNVDVLVANVGDTSHPDEFLFIGAKKPEDFLWDIDINLKATYLSVYNYLTTFTSNDPATATGTIISISSVAAINAVPGMTAYAISKTAIHRLLDSVRAEYPSMRVFSLDPGLVTEGSVVKVLVPFALDKARLSGGLSLWLNSKEADFLNGRWVSVHWDVEELLQHKEEIEKKGLLKSKILEGHFGPDGYAFGM